MLADWIKEAGTIIILLGGLEVVLWLIDRHELKEQTSILEEIACLLSVQEAATDEDDEDET